jgi:hypothetical protein
VTGQQTGEQTGRRPGRAPDEVRRALDDRPCLHRDTRTIEYLRDRDREYRDRAPPYPAEIHGGVVLRGP